MNINLKQIIYWKNFLSLALVFSTSFLLFSCASTGSGTLVRIGQLETFKIKDTSDVFEQNLEKHLENCIYTLKQNPNYHLRIEVYWDNKDKKAKNEEYAEYCLDKVKMHLLKYNMPLDRFTFTNFGEENPYSDNNTEQGRALNRRFEITIIVKVN